MKKFAFLLLFNVIFVLSLKGLDNLNSWAEVTTGHEPILWCLAAFFITEIGWLMIGQRPRRFWLRLIPAAIVLVLIYIQITTTTGSFSLTDLSERDILPAVEMACCAFLAGYLYTLTNEIGKARTFAIR